MGAIITLVLNGFGHDAMKLARSVFEIELNIQWLKMHPEDIRDYTEFVFIQQKQIYDTMSHEQQIQVPPEQYRKMMDDYQQALPRFVGKNKKEPRNEWCSVSLYRRAKEAGRLDLYRTFYREASSMHHADIGGLIAQVDEGLNLDLAPSWSKLWNALTCGIGCFLLCVNLYDEMAGLGYAGQLRDGPNRAYQEALQANLIETPRSIVEPGQIVNPKPGGSYGL